MAETSTQVLRFVLFAPFNKDISELKNSVYPEHRRVVVKLHEEGFVELGGPLSDPVNHNPTASLIIFRAKNFEEVEKLIKSDVYYTSGVWDIEKLNLLELGPGVPRSN